MYKVEKVLPFDHSDSSKSVQVERMFDQIAAGYDTMNHTMSLNMDKRWRTRGIKALADIKPQRILDVATGTGDLAIEAYMRLRPASIVGIDISEQMMNVGRTKVERLGLGDSILFDRQNCCDLSFEDESFDAVMAAFGVRNFEDLDKGLCEMLRVLRRGGGL